MTARGEKGKGDLKTSDICFLRHGPKLIELPLDNYSKAEFVLYLTTLISHLLVYDINMVVQRY